MDRSSRAAAAAFAAARKAGSRNPNLFYWAPSMGNDYNVSIEALQQTIAAHPDFTAARLRLATMLLAVRQPQEAYDVLKQLKKVDQKQALEYFPVYIRAAWTLKKIEEARAAASQFVKTARAERDKDRAKEMFAFAMEDPPAEEEKLAARAALPERETNFEVDTTELTVPEDSNLEVVRENGQVSVRAKPLSFVEGMMVLLECDQPQPIANVKTKEGTVVRLIIDEPGNVHLVNAKTGSGDLVCGQQSNNVRLGYYPKDGPGTRTAGSIRRFEYLP
jgi:tetratricopeptide (TPR) repeat protein